MDLFGYGTVDWLQTKTINKKKKILTFFYVHSFALGKIHHSLKKPYDQGY